MQKLELRYEGKAKKIFATDKPGILWVEFKDDATAFNGQKKGTIDNKGRYNNLISATIFKMLSDLGVENHFVELISDTEMLVKGVEIIPVELVVRNITAGSLCRRLGIKEGIRLETPLVEFYYKNDELGDPLITEDHIRVLNIAAPEEVVYLREEALKINSILIEYFRKLGIDLVDYKLEFGKTPEGKILLADEISPDTCRLWDKSTGDKLDKDRFRLDMGKVEEAYQEILRRVRG
ncbi:phosphoribosylaminoimidazolesuccinocarboxamide synthase [Anoxybacter fermentans]|uniref:Phosphoribosylaminoimidazole-succinocarboxamide synthase n=1 Tax=Anoxybacter fermentans TaxID=1323375 RepID=A0A3S9T348_9FIRM|nr:phosphoribosylaminoimidazolesuccinocarboxamide synthase [Anoxybacter fermentans]AZR74931.1 phosphoribosylaminoimidazolesuccinocarboxamide synthase [Anoxybacter fermentans]